jgi:hypothetical protein
LALKVPISYQTDPWGSCIKESQKSILHVMRTFPLMQFQGRPSPCTNFFWAFMDFFQQILTEHLLCGSPMLGIQI